MPRRRVGARGKGVHANFTADRSGRGAMTDFPLPEKVLDTLRSGRSSLTERNCFG